jgi:hypothetical protein
MNASPSPLFEPMGPDQSSMYSHLAHHTENELGQPPKQPVRPHLQQQKPLLTSTQQNTVALPAILSVRHGLYRNCQSPARSSRETHFFDFLFPCEGD